MAAFRMHNWKLNSPQRREQIERLYVIGCARVGGTQHPPTPTNSRRQGGHRAIEPEAKEPPERVTILDLEQITRRSASHVDQLRLPAMPPFSRSGSESHCLERLHRFKFLADTCGTRSEPEVLSAPA